MLDLHKHVNDEIFWAIREKDLRAAVFLEIVESHYDRVFSQELSLLELRDDQGKACNFVSLQISHQDTDKIVIFDSPSRDNFKKYLLWALRRKDQQGRKIPFFLSIVARDFVEGKLVLGNVDGLLIAYVPFDVQKAPLNPV